MNMRKTFAIACAIAASLTQAIELNSKTFDNSDNSEIVSLMVDNF